MIASAIGAVAPATARPPNSIETSVLMPSALRNNISANTRAMRRTNLARPRLQPARAFSGGHGSVSGHHGGRCRR